MTRRTHARFITGDLGSLLAIEQGGQILANEAGADINRMARASEEKSEGRHYVEVLIYGDGTIANSVSVGVATASASLSTYVGGDAESYGYRAGEGAVHHNGSATVTGLDALVDGDIVRMELDLASDPQVLKFWLNGDHQTDVSLGTSPGSGETWHLAVSLAGTNDADLRAFLNAGQRDFEYEDDFTAGWYTTTTLTARLNFASDPYITARADSPPNTIFHSALVEQGMKISRRVSFWPFSGRAETAQAVSSLQLLDPDGDFNDLITSDVRDAPLWLQVVDKGAALSTATRIASAIVDHVSTKSNGEKIVHLRGNIASLDRAVQRRLFAPNIQSVANNPWPIALGAVRNYEPPLIDDSTNTYAINDQAVTSMGDVRVQGVALDPNAGTPEYTLSGDRTKITLNTAADGKVTVEVSSLGGAATSGQSDLWGGIGDPFADADVDGDPDNWDRLGSSDGVTDPQMNVAGSDIVRFPNEYFNYSWMADTGVTITPGKTYKVEALFVNSVIGVHRPKFILSLRDSTSDPSDSFYQHVNVSIREDEPIVETFSVADDWIASQNIPHVVVYANNITGGRNNCEYVRLFELPDAFAATELDGLGLEAYCKEILTSRANLDASNWSASDAAAIDTATSYEIGYYTGRPTAILDALLAVMDSWTASLYEDADGVIRFLRLTAPEDTADIDVAGTVDRVNIRPDAEPAAKPDLAAGLTTTMACRRNVSPYDGSDFGDSTTVEVNTATRRALSREYQETVTSGRNLPGMYKHAELAPPLGTALEYPEHAAQELDRVLALYENIRWFYRVGIFVNPGEAFEIGDVVELTWAALGLSSEKLLVVEYDYDVLKGTQNLVLWG